MDSSLASGLLPVAMGTHKFEVEPGIERAADSIKGEESVQIRLDTLGRLTVEDRVDMFEVDSLPEELHRDVSNKGVGHRTFTK